jgi:signal peptidase I
MTGTTEATLRSLAQAGAPSVTPSPFLAERVLASRRRRTLRRRSLLLAVVGMGVVGGTVAARSTAPSRFLSVYEPNASMGSTVAEGEHLIVDRTLTPGYDDVVDMRYAAGGYRGTTIRRVIGLPGDLVACPAGSDGRCHAWTRNGTPLTEPFAHGDDTKVVAPVTVGPGEVYVLGDQRDNAVDSRFWDRPARLDDIIGVGVVVYDGHGGTRPVAGAPPHERPGQVNIDPPTVPTSVAVPG